MACIPIPTETLFSTFLVTTDSLSTTSSVSVSTIPGTTTTIVGTTCPVSLAASITICPNPVTTSSVSTAPGSTTTVTNQVVVTVPIVNTESSPTKTLFSTCPDSPPPTTSGSGSTSSESTSSTATLTPNPNTSSEIPVVITPPPTTTTTTSQSTLPDGRVTAMTTVLTITPSPTTSYISASAAPGLNQSSAAGKASANLGPIIGGTLGGFFGLLAIVAAFLCYRRSKQWDDIFEKDIGHGIGDDDIHSMAQLEPAPYHYGLVGHTVSPSFSPPTSPTPHHLAPNISTSQYSSHTRLSSSAATSVRSRESTLPLNAAASDAATVDGVNRPQGRRGSLQGDIPLLRRPLTAPAATGDGRISSYPGQLGSPTSPRFPPTAFYVTNNGPTDPGPSTIQMRPVSAGAGSTSPTKHRRAQLSITRPVIVHTDGGRVSNDAISPVETPQPDRPDQPPAYTHR